MVSKTSSHVQGQAAAERALGGGYTAVLASGGRAVSAVAMGWVHTRAATPFCTFLCGHPLGIPCMGKNTKVKNDCTGLV
jgi:hypothetical protein